jgi:hypothetical protein
LGGSDSSSSAPTSRCARQKCGSTRCASRRRSSAVTARAWPPRLRAGGNRDLRDARVRHYGACRAPATVFPGHQQRRPSQSA